MWFRNELSSLTEVSPYLWTVQCNLQFALSDKTGVLRNNALQKNAQKTSTRENVNVSGGYLKGQQVQIKHNEQQLFTSDEGGLPSVVVSTSSRVSFGGGILFLGALALRSSRKNLAVTAGPPTRNTLSGSSSPLRVATIAFDGRGAWGRSISLYNVLQFQIW